jgi:hypothetical protein
VNSILVRIGVCALVSVFGTAILIPSLRFWSDVSIVLWALFVLAAGIAIGTGSPPIKTLPRLFVALIPSACIAAYVSLRVVVLQHTISLSGLNSDNVQFWILFAYIVGITWVFTFALSYSSQVVAMIVGFFVGKESEGKIERASKTITAIIGLISVVGLLLNAVGIFPS